MDRTTERVSVRYIVDDVTAAIEFYTTHLGFSLNMSAAPAFADSDLVEGPGGREILLAYPAGNLVELFEPAHG